MEGELQVVIGRNLRRIREMRGMSQEAFGDLLGFHPNYVGNLERGERNLTVRSIERLADVLGVNVLALLVDPGAARDPAPRKRRGRPPKPL